ncbi:MAG: GntR family transcriptional regulator [Neomegalonema sp.]|nr:GntR family transcriptional regulator [Neomegalonema sp.]
MTVRTGLITTVLVFLHSNESRDVLKKIERSASLSEQVAEALRAEIVSGRLQLGEVLSETRIATSLGVSRTPVREAFSRLENDGLLITKPKSGTYVFNPTPEELRDLNEMRVCLEVEALRLSLQRSANDLSADIQMIRPEMQGAFERGDPQLYLAMDRAFHQAMIERSGNQLLIEMYQPIADKIGAITSDRSPETGDQARSHDQHLKLFETISLAKVNEAVSALREHLAPNGCVAI